MAMTEVTATCRARGWMLLGGVVVLGIVGLISMTEREPVVAPSFQASVPSIVTRGSGTEVLSPLLNASSAFADDAVFLVVASARERCEPTHAHELAAMAALARLPVLAGVTDALGTQPDLRTFLLAAVRDVARRAPCAGPFTMAIGDFRQRLDIGRYAAAFPDSYFDPAMTLVPQEFAGHALDERSHDECGKVAYAVLPLDAPRAWQCAGLRAQGRERVRALCRVDGPADATAMKIREAIGRMPSTCQ